MPPADFDLHNGSTFQPNLACQILLAEAASPSAGRDAARELRGLICDELLARGKVADTRDTAYGPPHRVLSDLTGPNGRDATLVTCWLVEDRAGLSIPWLTTVPSSPSHRKPRTATATSCRASSPGVSTRSSRPDQTPAAIAADDLDGGGRYLMWPTSVLGSARHTRSSVPYSSGPTKVR